MNARQAVILVITVSVVVLAIVNPPQLEVVTLTVQAATNSDGSLYRHWTVREPVGRFYSKVRPFPEGRQPDKGATWRQDPHGDMRVPGLVFHASDVTYETDEARLLGECSLVVACGALFCVLFGSRFIGRVANSPPA
jgi:hypothetical protein